MTTRIALILAALCVVAFMAADADADPAANGVGHQSITCDVDGELLSITETISGTTRAMTGIRRMLISNPSGTVVRIYSGNGRADTEGTPLCNAVATCATDPLDLPVGNGQLYCDVAAGTQAIFLLGFR